ncbi:TetR/AcrR family transcriptional regulator [Oleomonas cavernae]|uniref:TetR/AcrR family transcriptional regulator n=1 Tax=Oleomonas cavernae TaxID=2320859 RepID=A0A418WHD5_9PROT|nr:TetR/AcrR family transcriptional regulator [Oleomonas cavernae]
MRAEALEIGRRLLLAGGPSAVTLKSVGAEMGMTHANLIHHFGSAVAFQAQIQYAIVKELVSSVTGMLERFAAGTAGIGEIVDEVFDAYTNGGLGALITWWAITKPEERDPELEQAMVNLVAVLEQAVGGTAAGKRARAMVWLVCMVALGNSLVGPTLNENIGADPKDMRDTTVWLLEQLQKRGPVR